MKDRIPVNPGRVLINPEDGSAPFYATMTRADNPTQEGTPLNKDSLLKDATAALFGLGADAVPDDVLTFLGKYSQYWWKRRVYTVVHEISLSTASSNVYFSNGYMAPNTVYYAADIEISSDGVVSLKNPQTLTCPRGEQSLDLLTAVKGMYVCNTLRSNSSGAADSKTVYLISSSATFSLDSSGSPYTDSANAQKVSTHPVNTIGEWVYIMSSDRNAYPDSGISDGYEYQYLGVPFENAVTAPAIETGSYVGTGTYGSANPCSLTFDFVPKLVIVSGQGNSSNYGAGFIYCWGSTKYTLIYGGYGGAHPTCVVSLADKTMNWYDTNSVNDQCNDSKFVFNYIAIG